MPKHLITGFNDFLNNNYLGEDGLMQRLVKDGQDPDYFVITCIDSRAHAGTVFQLPPGTFFAHKSMGAIVRPYKQGRALSAALQFALIHNNVKTIVIMGHTGCGAVKALIDNIEDPEIHTFVTVAQDALDVARHECGAGSDLQRCAEESILKLSLKNLKNYPSVKYRLAKNDIEIKTWLFDMHEGTLLEYNEDDNQFHTLVGKEA